MDADKSIAKNYKGRKYNLNGINFSISLLTEVLENFKGTSTRASFIGPENRTEFQFSKFCKRALAMNCSIAHGLNLISKI